MPKADLIPTTRSNVVPLFCSFSFQILFEELPLWRDGIWRAGAIDGIAEIVFDFNANDWHVADITLQAHNGRCGDAAQGKSISLSSERDESLYEALLDSLSDTYGTYIEERVADELAARGFARAA